MFRGWYVSTYQPRFALRDAAACSLDCCCRFPLHSLQWSTILNSVWLSLRWLGGRLPQSWKGSQFP